jgi:hypothetical protein
MQVNGQSNPGELPIRITGSGRVSADPGDYQLGIALSGRIPQRAEPVQIDRIITVHVASADAG